MVEKINEDLYKLDKDTYLKKFKKNWGIIFPLKKDLTIKKIRGNFNWKNLFRTKLSTIIFIALVLFLVYGYYHDTKFCHEIIKNPCIMNEYERCKTIDENAIYLGWGKEGDLIENERDTPAYISSDGKAP